MAAKKSKTGRRVVVLLVIVALLAGAGYAVFVQRKDQTVSVQVDTVKRRDLTEVVVATGQIQPVVEVKINPEVSGEIVELPVKEGQHVNKGDLLVKIKQDNYLASVSSAEASLRSAQAGLTLSKAQLDKAKLEFERNSQLFRDKLISDSVQLEFKTALEVARAQADNSSNQVDQAQAALERSREDLAKTVIGAPNDGTITKLNSQLGERVVGTAMMAGTEIMRIANLRDMEARVDIGEMDVVLIKPGQTARLEVDAFRDKKIPGTVTEIANSAKTSGLGSQNQATSFEVRIRVGENVAFRPGMSVTAEIETRHRTNVITVPIQSVTTRPPKPKAEGNTAGDSAPTTERRRDRDRDANKPIEVVFLVKDGVAKMTPVERGISDDDYTEIVSGVTEGETVVSGGYKALSRDLEDGKPVTVTAESVKPGAKQP